MPEALLEADLAEGLLRQPRPVALPDSFAGPDEQRQFAIQARRVSYDDFELPSSTSSSPRATAPAGSALPNLSLDQYRHLPEVAPSSPDELAAREAKKIQDRNRELQRQNAEARTRALEAHRNKPSVDQYQQLQQQARQAENQRLVEERKVREARQAQWESDARDRLARERRAADHPRPGPVDKSPPAKTRPTGPDSRPATPRTAGKPVQPLREAPQIHPAEPRVPVKSAARPLQLPFSGLPRIPPRVGIPLVGGLVELPLRTALGQPLPQAAAGTAGSVAGGLVGAGVGGALAGPVGGFVGGLVGGYLGGALGDALGRKLFPGGAEGQPQGKIYHPPFKGGQSPVLYRLEYQEPIFKQWTEFFNEPIMGPIVGLTAQGTGPNGGSCRYTVTNQQGQTVEYQTAHFSSTLNQVFPTRILRADGLPDTGGNPPPLPDAPVTPGTAWNPQHISPPPQRSQPPGDTPQQPFQLPQVPFLPGLRDGGTPRGDNPADGPRQWPKHGGPADTPHPDNMPGNLGGMLPGIKMPNSPGASGAGGAASGSGVGVYPTSAEATN